MMTRPKCQMTNKIQKTIRHLADERLIIIWHLGFVI